MSSIQDTSILTRISDVQYEPNQFLLPIQGYEKMPLVSLEQAIAPLIGIIPDIQRMVYTAKERCKNPIDDLSPDESASICLYTMQWPPKCLYSLLNETLREEDRQILAPWFSYLKLYLTALWKLPSVQCKVWRGVKRNLSSDYVKNERRTWWGFSSTTRQIDILTSDQFLGQHGERTLFNIECKHGKLIKNHSYYKKENEVLLVPATQLEVVGVLPQGNGLYIIDLREVQPPYPLLEPPFSQQIKTPASNASVPLQQTQVVPVS
jgi:hypothetical protein